MADIGVSCPALLLVRVLIIDSNLSLETVFADPFETLLAGLAGYRGFLRLSAGLRNN